MVPRALEVLQSVDVIAAEDTRRTGQLCSHFGINTRMRAYHDHNEDAEAEKLIALLDQGLQVALVSDAGMPLISDPGYRLLSSVRQQGHEVTVVPGACAAITALAGSGLPSDRFLFLGFPPAKHAARQNWLQEYESRNETLVFYESSHRILSTLQDMNSELGSERKMALARELTKQYETWLTGEISEVLAQVESDANQQKGEFVLVVQGADKSAATSENEILRYMAMLIPEMPIKKAAAITAELLGAKKKHCYEVGLKIQGR